MRRPITARATAIGTPPFSGGGGVLTRMGGAGRRLMGRVPPGGRRALGVVGGVVGTGVAFDVTGRAISRLIDPRTGLPVRRKKINPLNVRALRRATTRLSRFSKISRRVEKQLARLAPSRRRAAPGGKKCR